MAWVIDPAHVVLSVEYAGQVQTPWGTTSAGFNAQTKINRKDGITYWLGMHK
jgi:polyisoprenoid-binding protein YceI